MTMPARKSGQWTIESLAERVSKIVAEESGNVLDKGQQTMVISRLKKRLIDLGGVSPDEYYSYLVRNYESESTQLVSMLTTHHTFFFREFSHFEHILKNLDDIVARVKARGENVLKVFSAACSRGQEVYSLAMFFKRHLSAYPGMDFQILGSDIDPVSVNAAKNGVYPFREVKSIPQIYLEGNWQRGKGEISDFAKVKDSVKEKCSFEVMNLLNINSDLKGRKFDMIFCRNVFIYFKSEDVKTIVGKLKTGLHPGGLLFTGLSESLKEMGLELNTHAPSVYSFDRVSAPKLKREPIGRPVAIPAPIKVLAVDDSPSVLKLLGKIFESDPQFELVGTASNGAEANAFLQTNQVDAMTLDIHMPEMDGVEYLKRHFGPGHPKVIVVSSASREDARYAQQTLRYGACDFVEKPALNNLGQRAEEIKNKIKMSFLNHGNAAASSALDRSFARDFVIENAQRKSRVFFANFSGLSKLKGCLRELRGEQPPVFVFFEGNANYLDVIKDELRILKAQVYSSDEEVVPGKVYLCDFEKHQAPVWSKLNGRATSVAVFGMCSQKASSAIKALAPGQLLIEDLPGAPRELRALASDVFPWTSFAHVGTEFLAKEAK